MSKSQLFREESIKSQTQKLDGDVIIAQPIKATLLIYILLLLLVLIFIFISTTSFDRKEKVNGFLEPENGISRVVAPRAGVVETLFVSDGEMVKQGQPLMLLKTQEHLSEGVSYYSLVSANLQEQVGILENRKKQIKEQVKLQEKELTRQVSLLMSQLEDISEQKKLVKKRLDINELRLFDLKSLTDNGLLSIEETQQQQELVLSIQQKIAELNVNRQSYLSQLEQVNSDIKRLPIESGQKISTIKSEISRLEQQKIQLSAQNEILIKAPVSGVITNLKDGVGQNINASRSILTILPENSELEVVLLIPTRAYGFIKEGQEIRIRFEAFPYQHFGSFEGEISRTSKSIILPNEMSMPVSIQEPVYRVEATLAEQSIDADGDSVRLRSGMLLSADIVLERRSLLEWLFESVSGLSERF